MSNFGEIKKAFPQGEGGPLAVDEVENVGNDLYVIPDSATQGVPYNTSPPPAAEPLLKEKPLKGLHLNLMCRNFCSYIKNHKQIHFGFFQVIFSLFSKPAPD